MNWGTDERQQEEAIIIGPVKNPEDLKKKKNLEDLTGYSDSRDAKDKNYSRDRKQDI